MAEVKKEKMSVWSVRLIGLLLLLAGGAVGYFVYTTELNPASSFNFKLGLDLSGGTQLVYRADISQLDRSDVNSSLEALRDVIERRVNLFGVSEPLVQLEKGSVLAGVSEERVIVELPGISNVNEAVRIIGETPTLEFRLVKEGVEILGPDGTLNEEAFTPTGLTGRLLTRAALQFGNGQHALSNEPIVSLEFNSEGAELFAKITRENVGRQLAIFLDGKLESSPVIQQEITGGSAVITGNFTPEEARELVRNLNLGALPVPIELIQTESIGASLGAEAVEAGLMSGLIGFSAVAVFLLLWYRLPGAVAVVALFLYITLMLAIFKLIPVVLTAAGIAGFILSIGLAVDANILIFERMKEELRAGREMEAAMHEGFRRAWTSIRDSNIAHIIAGVILFWFGTSLIKGFALVFTLGVVVSMLSAITISRTFLLALKMRYTGLGKFLFRSGVKN